MPIGCFYYEINDVKCNWMVPIKKRVLILMKDFGRHVTDGGGKYEYNYKS